MRNCQIYKQADEIQLHFINELCIIQYTQLGLFSPSTQFHMSTHQQKVYQEHIQQSGYIRSAIGQQKMAANFGQLIGLTNQSTSISSKNSYFTRYVPMESKKEQYQQIRNKISATESLQYQRFNQRLHGIEDRINQLKSKLQRKKQEKQKREVLRRKIIEERRVRQQYYRQESQRKKRDNQSVTKLEQYLTKQKKKSSFKIQKLGGLVTQAPEHEGHPIKFNPYSPRNNIYYVSQILKGYKDEESLVREHLKNSIEFLAIFSEMNLPSLENRALNLSLNPYYKDKITVIFDLDETLIHCNDDLQEDHQIQLQITFPTGESITAGINIRPNAQNILAQLAPHVQIIVFTASHPCYANVVLDYLDPTHQYIQHRLYREDCFLVPGGPYVKDLRIINRDPKKMVLVDNAAYSYAFQPNNGIPIIPYYEGTNDYQLLALQNYINQLRFVEDVRIINSKTFKLEKYPEYSPEQVDLLVEQLYGKMKR